MLKLIHSQSDLTSMNVPINMEAMIKGILIRITGMNAAAVLLKGDVGRLQLLRNGQIIVDAGADYIHSLDDHIGGYNNFVSGVGGGGGVEAEDTNYAIYIPCRFFDDNVMLIQPQDNVHLRCTFNSNLNTKITSAGLIEVYLDLEVGVQKYILNLHQFSLTIAGASTRPFTIDTEPNILMALCSATVSSVITLVGSNITDLGVEIGNNKADYSLGALVDSTTFEWEHEASYLLSAVAYAAKGDLTSRLNDIIECKFTVSGASAPEFLILSAKFENDSLGKTISMQRARLTTGLAFKAAQPSITSKETVAVVKRMSGITGARG